MKISFRIRLFVLASVVVGAVLAVVITIAWSGILASQRSQLDERLCMEARRLATQPFQGRDLLHLQNDMASKLRLRSSEPLMLLFESAEGAPNLQSANWHEGLALTGPEWAPAKRNTRMGRPDERSERAPPRPADDLRLGPRDRPPNPGRCELTTFSHLRGTWRAAGFTVPPGLGVVAVEVAATQEELQDALHQALIRAVPLAVVLTALGAWLLSNLTMRPVNRLREAMRGVTQKALAQRLPTAREDREFKELIEAFNTMLARLDASFQQASRFSADAAHELKTPLTILQGRIEQAIVKSENRAIQTDLAELLDEVGRLSAITRKLLLLSQADAGQLALQLAPVDLTALLDELAHDANMILDGQTLHCAVDRQLSLECDGVLLRQLLNNLLSNAVRYCAPGGWIKISASAQADCLDIVFANASPAISRETRARFFDRFFRGDTSHSRHIDGNGLGLSLAREIARAHGGMLVLEETPLCEVSLRLTLPIRSPAR